MSRKPHQIVQNDVRFSVLPEHADRTDREFGTGRSASKRLARPRRRAGGSLEAADALTAGLYRTRGEGDRPNNVRVLSNGCPFFITEAEYRRREGRPFVEDLPWYGSHDGKLAGGKS